MKAKVKSKWAAQYMDSRWQQKRLEIMARDKWTCKSCGATGEGVTLNVHHAYYESGKKPWEYPEEALVTWCSECHEKRHRWKRLMDIDVAAVGLNQMKGAISMLRDYPRTLCAISECEIVCDRGLASYVANVEYAYKFGKQDGKK